MFGLKRYLNIALPFPIKLEKGGFEISVGNKDVKCPLYLHRAVTLSAPQSTNQNW